MVNVGDGERTWLFSSLPGVVVFGSLAIAVSGCDEQPVAVNRPQYMASTERAPYIKDFEPSCLAKVRTSTLSRHLSEQQRAQYCSCAAFRSAETITLEEIRAWNRAGDADVLKPHMAAVDNYCLERLILSWLAEISGLRPAEAPDQIS